MISLFLGNLFKIAVSCVCIFVLVEIIKLFFSGLRISHQYLKELTELTDLITQSGQSHFLFHFDIRLGTSLLQAMLIYCCTSKL